MTKGVFKIVKIALIMGIPCVLLYGNVTAQILPANPPTEFKEGQREKKQREEREEQNREMLLRAEKLEEQTWKLSQRIEADLKRWREEDEQRPYSVLGPRHRFSVDAVGKSFAEKITETAEDFYDAKSMLFFGRPMPIPEITEEGKGKNARGILIHVECTEDGKDEGLMAEWPGGAAITIFVNTSRRNVLSTLKHEMTHALFANAFHCGFLKVRMPQWANEGLASLQDDPDRKKTSQNILNEMVRKNKYPNVFNIMTRRFRINDEPAYAHATALTEFLLKTASNPKIPSDQTPEQQFIEFVQMGEESGNWTQATKNIYGIYGISSLNELQAKWQAWLIKKMRDRSAEAKYRSKE